MTRVWWFPLLLVAGCGPAQKGASEPKLPAARPEAVDALKDAARSVRLGPANYERALERLKAAEQLDDHLWEAFLDEGWLKLKLRNAAEAVPPLEHALSLYPSNASVVETLGEAYQESGRAGDAARIYRAWLERPAAASDAGRADAANAIRVALGAALRRSGKLDDAIVALQKALAATPRSAAALNQLGLVYQARGQLELADLVLHRALDADEKSKAEPKSQAATWNNLGLVALSRRRDQEAFAHFDQAAKLDPQLSVARRNKAVVYLDCGDYARAVEELRHVTRADADDVEAWVALGVAERGKGNLDGAQRAFDKALELQPDEPDALYDLGILAMDFKKEPARARTKLEQFLKVAPKDHPKRGDAEQRMKELAAKAPSGSSSEKEAPK